MKTFLSLSSLARRANMPGVILRNRLAALSIEADGLAVKETAHPGLLYDVERVDEILALVKEAGSRARSSLTTEIR